MLAGILIIAFSLVLLIYWFRYSCMLILRGQTEHVSQTAASSRFGMAEVQKLLATEAALDPLHMSLERDYKVIKYLLEHAAGLEIDSLEDRLLVLDYRVMRLVYRVTRIAAPAQARHALGEMASVLGVLDRRIGQRAGVQTEA